MATCVSQGPPICGFWLTQEWSRHDVTDPGPPGPAECPTLSHSILPTLIHRGYLALGFFQIANRYSLSPADTLISRNNKALDYQHRLVRAIEPLDVSSARKRKLLSLIGVGPCPSLILLSDAAARIEASNLLCQCTAEFVEANVSDGRRMFHLTFADDIGLTSDRTPTLRFAAMNRKVDNAIRFMGLSGLAMSEVQPLVNYPRHGRGRTLMLNSHALCWGDVSRRGFRESLRTLNHSRSWSNRFGALPIKSRELHNGADDAHLIASYIAKMPSDAKRLVPRGSQFPGEFRFAPTTEGYSARLALRVAEGLSHYTVFDAVFGVNEGKYVRKAWKAQLLAWHSHRLVRCGQRSSFNVERMWQHVRERVGPDIYAPYQLE